MSRVRRDRHGLFVITDGSVFRPQLALYEYETSGRTLRTVFQAGDAVRATHLSQTPFARLSAQVNGLTVEELWGSHGSRWQDGGTVPSDAVWSPRETA